MMTLPILLAALLAQPGVAAAAGPPPPAAAPVAAPLHFKGQLAVVSTGSEGGSRCEKHFDLALGKNASLFWSVSGAAMYCANGWGGLPSKKSAIAGQCEMRWEPIEDGGIKAEIRFTPDPKNPGDGPPANTFEVNLRDANPALIPLWTPAPKAPGAKDARPARNFGLVVQVSGALEAPIPTPVVLALRYERAGAPDCGPGSVIAKLRLGEDGSGIPGKFELQLPAYDAGDVRVLRGVRGTIVPHTGDDGAIRMDVALGFDLGWELKVVGAAQKGATGLMCTSDLDTMIVTLKPGESAELNLPPFRRCGKGFRPEWWRDVSNRLYIARTAEP